MIMFIGSMVVFGAGLYVCLFFGLFLLKVLSVLLGLSD